MNSLHSRTMYKRRSSTMSRFFCLAGAICSGLFAFGCWASNPCEPGDTIMMDSCYPAAAKPPAKTDAGPEVTGDGSAPATKEASFGKTCAAASDCAAGSPICGAPQLPYCTQINCQDGEENAGACPSSGWQCLKVGNNPSVCLKSQ